MGQRYEEFARFWQESLLIRCLFRQINVRYSFNFFTPNRNHHRKELCVCQQNAHIFLLSGISLKAVKSEVIFSYRNNPHGQLSYTRISLANGVSQLEVYSANPFEVYLQNRPSRLT